ncbi:hypothetical protein EDB83DRAFT_2444775 [Lactarius deliciosus]|nr:hypothetical protein EDB83DRAFT_2444775 [Lactarius deliciosus]
MTTTTMVTNVWLTMSCALAQWILQGMCMFLFCFILFLTDSQLASSLACPRLCRLTTRRPRLHRSPVHQHHHPVTAHKTRPGPTPSQHADPPRCQPAQTPPTRPAVTPSNSTQGPSTRSAQDHATTPRKSLAVMPPLAAMPCGVHAAYKSHRRR